MNVNNVALKKKTFTVFSKMIIPAKIAPFTLKFKNVIRSFWNLYSQPRFLACHGRGHKKRYAIQAENVSNNKFRLVNLKCQARCVYNCRQWRCKHLLSAFTALSQLACKEAWCFDLLFDLQRI